MTEENLQKQDVKLAIGKEEISDIVKTLQEKRKISGRVGSYEFKGTSRINFGDRGLFKKCEYDLAEIGRAVDIEAYIGQSVRKHREQILKEGFKLSGIDDNLIEYIENRLFEVALVTGITTAQTLRDVVLNLIMYHNAYIVFRRDKYRSTGKPVMMYGKTLQPIAGMFVPDPTTMECEVDKYGTIKRYRQTISSLYGEEEKEKIYPVEDVVHITMDKKSGYSYGTPYILPVLDDIRALRKLEELVVVLASKEAFPLYHYKIGTEESPAIIYEDGTSEIDVIEGKISGLPQQGYIVTSERIEVKVVSRDGSGLDIKPYLEYFEKRVLAGLRLSEVDLGRGGTSNRGCHDQETQTLTENGWKYYWEIDETKEKIATFNPESKKIEFHLAYSKYLAYTEENLHHYEDNQTDIMVTKDHKMWWKPVFNSATRNWVKTTSEQISHKKIKFLISTEGSSENLTEIEIPYVPYSTNVKHFDKGPKTIEVPLFCEFLGYFVSEGCLVRKQNSSASFGIALHQKPGIKADKIRSCLQKLPYNTTEVVKPDGTLRWTIHDKSLYNYLLKCGHKAWNKKIPNELLLKLSTKNAEILFDALILGDGTRDARHNRSSGSYYTTSEELAGQLQTLGLIIGARTKCKKVTRNKPRHDIYRITFALKTSKEREFFINKSRKEIPYKGWVYCYEVPNHLFITKRNGKVAIQGNTASTINKNMQDAAKDYQAVISDILTYKLILPLLLEGGFDITIKNLVLFMFPAIDAEEQRAHVSHGLSLYEASVIDLHEFRKEYLNKKPMSDEQMSQTARMFAHEGDKELTNLAGSFKASTGTGVTKKTSNTVRPENQSGKTTKKRITKNDFSEIVLEKIKEIKLNLLNQQDYSKEEVSSYLQTSMSDLVNLCVENSKTDITDSIKEGWQSAREEYESFNKSGEVDIEYIGNRAIDRFFKNFVHKSYWITINPFLDAINTCIADKELADQDFRYLTYIEDIYSGVKNLLKMQTKTANRFGYCSYVKRVGYKSIDVIDKDNNVLRTIDLSSGIIYTNLFPKEEDKKLIFLPRNIQDSNKEQNV